MKTYCDEHHQFNAGELPADFAGADGNSQEEIIPGIEAWKIGDEISEVLDQAFLHCRIWKFQKYPKIKEGDNEFLVCDLVIAKRMLEICSYYLMQTLGSQKESAEWMTDYIQFLSPKEKWIQSRKKGAVQNTAQYPE